MEAVPEENFEYRLALDLAIGSPTMERVPIYTGVVPSNIYFDDEAVQNMTSRYLSEELAGIRVDPIINVPAQQIYEQFRESPRAHVTVSVGIPLTSDFDQAQDWRTQYLIQLCSQTGRDFAAVMLEHYAECADRTAVNQIFFGQEATAPQSTIEDANKSKINDLFSRCTREYRLHTELQDVTRDCEEAYIQYMDFNRTVVDLNQQIDALKESSVIENYEEVQRILKKGQWTLRKVTGDAIEFVLMNDCILNWKDDLKKINISVNLGKFLLEYKPRFNHIKILGFKDNKLANGFYHPHVSKRSEFCWGNASATVNMAIRNYNVEKIAEMSYLVLHEYNPGSPYVRLTEFNMDPKLAQSGRAWLFSDHLRNAGLVLERAEDTGSVTDQDGNDWRILETVVYLNSEELCHYIRANGRFVPLDEEWRYLEDSEDCNWPTPEEEEEDGPSEEEGEF